MYRHINQHIGQVLDSLAHTVPNYVQDYNYLMDTLGEAGVNLAENQAFRRRYTRFWGGMRGLNNLWRADYFQVLQQHIGNGPVPDLPLLLRGIAIETMNNEALQFSYATKLTHMVVPASPIYDAHIRAFYLLPEPPRANPAGADIEERIGAKLDYCLGVHSALVKEYDRIQARHLLDQSIDEFDNTFNGHQFTRVKVIDSLLWAFVNWVKQGPAIVNGDLQYE